MSTNISEIYKLFLKFPLIITDSRDVKPNSIFFSLKGQNFNGNKFAKDALSKGAAFAVVDEIVDSAPNSELRTPNSNQYILVDDALKCLQELAKYHRKKMKIPFIGITGTNGKTTTKELINCVLQKKFRTVSTFGNFNNHIGVPLSILSCTNDTEIAIIEMGANHPGEIAELCEISKPNFGIITNISKAHLEGFGSFENIINTKKALYDYVRKKNGTIFVNNDNSLLLNLSENSNRVFYGSNNSDIRQSVIRQLDNINSNNLKSKNLKSDLICCGELLESNPFLNLKLYFNSLNSEHRTPYSELIHTKLIGDYNFENILAAAAIGIYFGISLKDIKIAIRNFMPGGYRSQFIETSKNKIIMDAYNANPTSMVAAINNFAVLNFTNKIVILGDMFELGKESFDEHKKIVALLKEQNFEYIILVGPLFSSAVAAINFSKVCNFGKVIKNSKFKIFVSSAEAADYFRAYPLLSKNILIKGSRGIKLEKIVDVL